jgi:DnaJ-class molecular chaperone
MQDHYKTLGVDRNASPDAIKKAYRQKASLYHPDKEGGSKVRFQEVEEAYRTLSDPGKRQQYDNPSPFGQQGFGFSSGGGGAPFDFETIFDIFGTRFHHPQQQQPRRQQARMTLWITLADSAAGQNRTISVGTQQGTHAVEIEIPKGINDGDTVQYGGVGPGGMDLVITYRIHPNPKWERHGQHLICEQSMSIWDLILGCDATITDLVGNTLTVTVPPGTQPGTKLRLKGRGMPSKREATGDLFVAIQAQIPDEIPEELLESIRQHHTK